jgi:hypothetical protein
MAAVNCVTASSRLHLGTRLRATTANSPLMIAGADLVAPSTSTSRPLSDQAVNWICRRAVDGAALYDNPPLLCKCRRAPSTQVKTGDLARIHRRMITHTPMRSLYNSIAVPAGRIQLSRQFFRSCEFRARIRQSSLQVAQQGFGNGKQPQINWQAIP